MKPKSTPDPATLRERALGYLARREHSRFELTRKLEAAGFSAEDIRLVLDEFEAKDWLSDRRFAESYVANYQAQYGNVKLAFELRQRGISNDDIHQAVLDNNQDSETERARHVWRKKFDNSQGKTTSQAKQARFLQSRGFTIDAIRNVLNSEA